MAPPKMNQNQPPFIPLPAPRQGEVGSVEEALAKRRSHREFQKSPISLEEVSQLLWAAQGITSGDFFRTAPSAGALYPLEIYLAVGEVDQLSEGIYHYNPHKNALLNVEKEDVRKELSMAALGQEWVREAAISIVIAAVYERITSRYGERGKMYTHMEVGHAAQNVYLQAEALNLGTVMICAFEDAAVKKVMRLKAEEEPMAILPIGKPR